MQIIYKNEHDTQEFDLERYIASLERYGTVDRAEVEEAIKEKVACYATPHVSVLVRVGAGLIHEEKGARAYYEEHKNGGESFERLRRITGYLVGSLSRWNTPKRMEEAARVKHGVDMQLSQQNEYQKSL